MKPYYQDGLVTLYHGDCREVLPEINGGVDLVVTDPPYVFGLASTSQEGKAGGWGDLMNNAVFYGSWLASCRRLLNARAGSAWVFGSWRSFPVLARAAYEIGWPIESLLVWDKEWIGPGGVRGLRPSYELVALFAEDGFAIGDRGIPDIWRCKWAGAKEWHPAEKPTALIYRMIEASGCVSGVLDPFAGSGSTLVAAKRANRAAIGIEIEERYCEIAAKRCSQEVLGLSA